MMTDTVEQPDPPTVLNHDQQQRQEALWAAGSALRSETTGNIFSKGGSYQGGSPNGLIAVAHFIITGGRDYLPADLDHPHTPEGPPDD